MKKKIFGIITLLALVGGACSKDEAAVQAEAYADDYRFFVRGKVDGLPVEYNAGEGEYFLETSYSFSDSVVVMAGKLAPDGSALTNAFVVKLRSETTLASPEEFHMEGNMDPGPLAFRDATEYRAEAGRYVLSFYCDTLSQYQSHLWHFPDGSVSTEINPVKTVAAADFEVYPVSLETTGNLCHTEVTHQIPVAKHCDATFDLSMLSALEAKLELENVIGAVEKVSWQLNGEPVGLSDSTIALAGLSASYEITCTVEFADGCTKIITKEFGTDLTQGCLTEFQYEKKKERVHDPRQLGTVELIYYDGAGKQYSSFYRDVMGDFEIVSTSAYGENERGEHTTRFFFETDAVLKSSDGSSVELTDVFGSFAVAHP